MNLADFSVYCPHGPHKFSIVTEGALSDLRLVYKDLYHVAGYPTGAGNPTWLNTHAPATATSPVLLKLMHAGMQIIGRVQTDELAYSLNGCNIHYGTPVNPAAPDRLPGGSSSGSAVAVARGEADAGLGTDTGGSIRVPACYNRLFGLRPTHGRLSSEHMVPLAPRFDTPGWLCRDAATLERVGAQLFGETPVKPEQADLLWATSLFALLPEKLRSAIAPIKQQLAACATSLHEWDFDPARLGELNNTFRTLQGREVSRTHSAWVAQHPDAFAPDIAERFQWAGQLTAEAEALAEATCQQWKADLTAQLNSAYLVIPTTPDLAPLRTASDVDLADFRMKLLGLTALAGLAGLPQVHLPLVKIDGVPFGLSLIGKPRSDMQLLALALLFSESIGKGK